MAKTVLIVDDDPRMHEFYMKAFEGDEYLVVGQAYDGQEGVLLYPDLQPDLVIMDWQMPKLDGIQSTAAICAGDPDANVMMFSWAPSDGEAKAAGARGAWSKTMSVDKFLAIVDEEMNREVQTG